MKNFNEFIEIYNNRNYLKIENEAITNELITIRRNHTVEERKTTYQRILKQLMELRKENMKEIERLTHIIETEMAKELDK